jgi:hypothetical protein
LVALDLILNLDHLQLLLLAVPVKVLEQAQVTLVVPVRVVLVEVPLEVPVRLVRDMQVETVAALEEAVVAVPEVAVAAELL